MYFLRRLMFWRHKFWVGRSFFPGHITVRRARTEWGVNFYLESVLDGPYSSREEAWAQAGVWADYMNFKVGH